MMVLYYINFNGTIKELDEWKKMAKEHWEKVKGVKLVGIYTPSIAWNTAILLETDSLDKILSNQGGRSDKVRNTDMVVLF
jgi:hypothetical protein